MHKITFILIIFFLISCKPTLLKTGTRLVDKPYLELGEKLYNLALKCWDRAPAILEIEQVVMRVITDEFYTITVHDFRGDAYLPNGYKIKGSGLVYPHFKFTLIRKGDKSEVITEERGVAYGRRDYFSSEVRRWLNGATTCSRHR
ncbi:MAG: hypothetical protein QM504_15020 [Pseudomonadota bacterium]